MIIPISLLSRTALPPARASAEAAGHDLYANEEATLYAGLTVTVGTGIALAIPAGYVGLIWPRSGWAVNKGIDTLAGVIDSDYRGEIKVVLANHGNARLIITPGMRIAQLLIQPVIHATFIQPPALQTTERRDQGFGSTGE